MWKPLLILALLTSACSTVPSGAVCDRTEGPADAHNAALIADGGPKSRMTGAHLLDLLDAGCDRL